MNDISPLPVGWYHTVLYALVLIATVPIWLPHLLWHHWKGR